MIENLADDVGIGYVPDDTEPASRALRQLKHVRNLLKHDLVSPPSDDHRDAGLNQHHENVRGADQYH